MCMFCPIKKRSFNFLCVFESLVWYTRSESPTISLQWDCMTNIVSFLIKCTCIWVIKITSATTMIVECYYLFFCFFLLCDKCMCVWQERIQEGMPALPGVCGQHVAAIVASVVGQPPDLALLASVTDFLLQLHPPTTRFINYTPSAFYLHPVWRKSAKLIVYLLCTKAL